MSEFVIWWVNFFKTMLAALGWRRAGITAFCSLLSFGWDEAVQRLIGYLPESLILILLGIPWWLVAVLVWLVSLVFAVTVYAMPKIQMEFSPEDNQCVHTTVFSDGRTDTIVKIFRVKVTYFGVPSTVCTGHVVDVTRNGQPSKFIGPLKLTFAPSESDDALNKTVSDRVPEFLDIGIVSSTDGTFRLSTKWFAIPNALLDLFVDDGIYAITVAVSTLTYASKMIVLELHKKDNWLSTEMIER